MEDGETKTSVLPMKLSSQRFFHLDNFSIVSSAGRVGANEEVDCIESMIKNMNRVRVNVFIMNVKSEE